MFNCLLKMPLGSVILEVEMSKVNHVDGLSEGALLNSLGAIKQAHDRLHFFTGMRASPTVLASQIELWDVLLVEISGIRSFLLEELRQTRAAATSHLAISSEAALESNVLRSGGRVAA
jgi:hypothetical protein